MLLAAIMVLSLMPVTVVAGCSDLAITNGTPESDSAKNHGYITIDKGTAAEGDPVKVTVNPAEGYQLKSLTAAPETPTIGTAADVLATVPGGFPTSDSQSTAPENAWIVNGETKYAYAYSTAFFLRNPDGKGANL